jgi:hypothetical protein
MSNVVIRDTRYEIRDAGCGIRDAGYKRLDS